jgi:dipeptide transport system ATP-binding protein
MALLEIDNLSVSFPDHGGTLRAVDGLDFAIDSGEVVGIVGESGSGKTVTAFAIMGLIDAPGEVSVQRMRFAGRDLGAVHANPRGDASVGGAIALIFQDPVASLDPCYTVAYQLDEVLRAHGNAAERASREIRRIRTQELLRQVEIPDPAVRAHAWPHQLSGGMAQRVMIAMALASRPQLLIADEPTTALDVTIQAQVLALLRRLQAEAGMALMLITHDLAVVAQMATRLVVMYAGQVIETGRVPDIFRAPQHPYTEALLEALPENNLERSRLRALPGTVPGARNRPPGCVFAPRCRYVQPSCVVARPGLIGEPQAAVRCLFPLAGPGPAAIASARGR